MSKKSDMAQQPAIVKYSDAMRNGVQVMNLSRNAVGYVTRGRKYIHYGDIRHEIRKGEIYFLNAGTHYIEDVADSYSQFEQIVLYYTPAMISDTLSILRMDFNMEVINDHQCEKCKYDSHAVTQSWPAARIFFTSVDQYLREDAFTANSCLEKMKMSELICLIMAQPECCIKSKMLAATDTEKESLERIVQMNIFEDISIPELADRCGRSLTSFKKDFNRYFHDSPHHWITRQRLTHARMLLISTTKTIAEIGRECGFHNTSHFIKLFGNEYQYTPATYRTKSFNENEPHTKKQKEPVL